MVKAEHNAEFFQSVVKNGSDLISIINADGFYTYASDSITRILGYSSDEMINQSPFQYVHEDDLPMVLSAFHQIFETDHLKLPYFRYKHKDGHWCWLHLTADNMLHDPTINGFVTNSRDVTDKVLAEQKREESNAFYEALYFNHPDSVITLCRGGHVMTCNTEVTKVTGFTIDELKGRHFSEFLSEGSHQETQNSFKRVLNGESHVLETQIRSKHIGLVDLSITLIPVFLNKRIEAIQCIAKDITENKRAEQQLKERARQLNNILGSITEPFIAMDVNHTVTYVNDAFLDYLKIKEDSLYGKVLWDVFPMIKGSHFNEKCLEVTKTGEAVAYEEYLDEIATVFAWKIYPFENGIAVGFTDVSAKKKAQEEQDKIALVANKTTNGVLITDGRGKIEWVNSSFEELTGYCFHEVVGKDPADFLYGPATQVDVLQHIRRMIHLNMPFSVEFINYTKTGQQIWVALDITPILNDNGEIIKFINIYSDVTDRKEAELKLLHLSNDLFKQNRDLQQFTYIVSHNLRAPVANVVGLTKMMQKLELGGTQYTTALHNLEKSAVRLDNVIKDLNKILSVKSNGQDGVLSNENESIEIEELITDVINSLQEMLVTANAKIQLSLTPGVFLETKRAYLYSIIHNLLTNAIKYRSNERDLLILLESVIEDNHISIRVKDNGSGMDMERVKPHLFMLYKRFHSHVEGRGLGLYLVKSQVEALQGSIEVDSEIGVGTEFKLSFNNVRHD